MKSEKRCMSMLQPNTHSGMPVTDMLFENKASINEVIPEREDEEPRLTGASEDFYVSRPANTIFLETSKEQDERVKKNSPFGHLKTWRLIKIIVKSNDDVRQEQFAMQLISQIYQIFKIKKLNLWLRPYEILATGARCGLLEFVTDALSIDSIKKKMGQQAKLIDYFEQ